ncbi:hypothetical protein EG327_008042 [Venturia inaequalis]|uniref:Uncharacterized protein n=1 Tax=Venturia inaequalis TaxID=5025 RepID=A0A8H3VSD6_VENIN|nr:hypothetical protein EG327_008042 [Venturia inaequalis]
MATWCKEEDVSDNEDHIDETHDADHQLPTDATADGGQTTTGQFYMVNESLAEEQEADEADAGDEVEEEVAEIEESDEPEETGEAEEEYLVD